jgi:pimeloyl-ACP methyl ester carboxylesterase
VKGLMLAWPSGGEYAAERLPKSFYRQYIRAALRQGMAGVVEVDRFAGSIAKRPENRVRLLSLRPYVFVQQMAFWESFFSTSADLPIVGCTANADEFASIKTPTIVISGNDLIHPMEVAKNLHAVMPDCRYHNPVMRPEEWTKTFNVIPFPQVSDLQGQRIAPLWREFIRQLES